MGRGGGHDLATPWRYYLWRAGSREQQRLADLRARLASALSDRGVRTTFGVGYFGSSAFDLATRPVMALEINAVPVVFLADSASVTDEVVEMATALVAGRP
jgi:hypothetical protein